MLKAIYLVPVLGLAVVLAWITGCAPDGGNGDEASATGWQTEIADDSGFVGIDASIAVDPSGNPHISYFDQDNLDLKHAWQENGTWQTETVDSNGHVGEESGIAVDSAGNIHVSYNDATNGALKYAKKSDGTWNIETLDQEPDHHVVTTSLSLTSEGLPRIAYNMESGSGGDGADEDNGSDDAMGDDDAADLAEDTVDEEDGGNKDEDGDTGDQVKYAVWDGKAWDISEVTQGGSDVYMALDNADQPHLCIVDAGPDLGGAISYAHRDESGWVVEENLDPESNVKGDCGIAVGADNFVHIAYRDFDRQAIKYLKWDEADWHQKVVANSVGRQEGVRVAVDSRNHPHIVYADANREKLRHAYFVEFDWEQETIDRMGIPSIIIDDQDRIHVAYGNTVDGDSDDIGEDREILKYGLKD